MGDNEYFLVGITHRGKQSKLANSQGATKMSLFVAIVFWSLKNAIEMIKSLTKSILHAR